MGKVIPMKRTTLSTAQANVLFNRECVTLGSNIDFIPVKKAIRLLSVAAVDCALTPYEKYGKYYCDYWCSCGLIKGKVRYLTYEGFIHAVGYYNTEQLILEGLAEIDEPQKPKRGRPRKKPNTEKNKNC